MWVIMKTEQTNKIVNNSFYSILEVTVNVYEDKEQK